MTNTRRAISMGIAITMVPIGYGSVGYLLLFSAWKGWMVMAAGGVGIPGTLWLYDDFINATPNS